MIRFAIACTAAALLVAAAPASAEPPEGKGWKKNAAPALKPVDPPPGAASMIKPLETDTVDVGNVILDTVLTEVERRLIRDYFTGTPVASLPPGLAKRDRLPPGLAKQVERNGTLPPGLHARALPDPLRNRLPRRAEEIDRVVVGNDVLLIERGTRLILDILENVVAS